MNATIVISTTKETQEKKKKKQELERQTRSTGPAGSAVGGSGCWVHGWRVRRLSPRLSPRPGPRLAGPVLGPRLAGPVLGLRLAGPVLGPQPAPLGDMVWLADQNAVRGQFRLGRVIATYPDKKGIVRDMDLKVCMGLPGPHISKGPE